MPDSTRYPFGCPASEPDTVPMRQPDMPGCDFVPPTSGWAAALRGMRNRCPKCQQARLFQHFLKPVPHCPACGQDWTHQRADDFPAYISILLTGHLMAPIIILLIRDFHLSTAALAAIIMPLAVLLMIGFLQPAKGAIIAVQWWLGMHGFERHRPALTDSESVS